MASSFPSKGRGRGSHLKGKFVVPDPHWTVSDLTVDQFHSNNRPSKPIELGRDGRSIEVMVNYYPIRQYPREGIVYQYHFEVQNRRNTNISREQRRALYNSWLKRFCQTHPQINRHKIAFDNQKIVITFGEPLPDIDASGIREQINGPNRTGRYEEYQLSMKRVGNPIDLGSLCSLEALNEPKSNNSSESNDLQNIRQVLSIVMHEYCSSNADYINNRTFFKQPILNDRHGQWNLGSGKAAWRGFYSCLVFANGTHQLLMNLDISHAVFLKKQPFLNFLCEIMVHSPCGKWQYGRDRHVEQVKIRDVVNYLDCNTNAEYYHGEIEFLLKHCKYLPVRSHVANKTIGYTIHDFRESAATQTFQWKAKNNQTITIIDYYKQQYDIDLQYPTLPTLKMQKESFVPMELVDVEPVRIKRISDEQRAMLCRVSTLKPPEYYQSIREVRNNPKQQRFEEDPFIRAWNINVDVNMCKVPARVLHMPKVIYTKQYHVNHQQCSPPGVWNNTNTQFHKPTLFPSVWAIINLSSKSNQVLCKEFYIDLRNAAADRGIVLPEPCIYEEYHHQQKSIDQMLVALKQMMEKNDDCQFFIVILPEDDNIRDRVYGEIKKLCELESGFGIVTQMVKLTAKAGQKPWNYSKLNNILLKINTKLNGINSILEVPDKIARFFARGHRIMYVGIDLSHGAPSLSGGRSTVAVVASADDIPNRYFKEIYMQERPAEARSESWEYVVNMKQIMKSLISQYDQHRGYPPKAIIIYRDGISTSEFDSVFEKELTAIRQACVELSPVYQPYLTYIIVNKRHHTRFFPTNSSGNIDAGTVIDSHDVTNPTTYDFFLNSHHAALGTSRPTHYHVLYDDNGLKPDEVQQLTNALCYTSARCTRSISIPAPVKYADLLAFRANFYIKIDDPLNADSITSNPIIPINQSVDIHNTIKITWNNRSCGQRIPHQAEPPPPSISSVPPIISSINASNTNSTSSEIKHNQSVESFATTNPVSSTLSALNIAKNRLDKPDELGTIGRKIEVSVNYFPILQFPQHGFVHRYFIQIQNKKGRILKRNHRRLLYESWLHQLCGKHPQIDRYKIVFDNQTAVFTYNQRLPNINEIVSDIIGFILLLLDLLSSS